MTIKPREEWGLFVMALQFMTRLPVSSTLTYTDERMSESAVYYPLVGVLVGSIGAVLFQVLSLGLPPTLSVIITLAALALLTGCLHEDGFADMCDGLGGGRDRQHALTIMKDSRLGTYGVCGLLFLLGTKLLALAAIPVSLIPWLLIVAHSLSRLSAVVVIASSQYVREEGTAKPISTGIRPERLTIPVLTGVVIIATASLALGTPVIAGVLVAFVVSHIIIRRYFERKLGGYTGDCLGATQQISEVAIFIGALACI